MRPRDRILANLESIYRESYDRARTSGDDGRITVASIHRKVHPSHRGGVDTAG